MASVESRLYIISWERERPDVLTGFFKEEDRLRVDGLRTTLGQAALTLLATQPGRTMSFEKLCLALRPDFFGRLKKGDYDKAVKQLLKDGSVLREETGTWPKLKPGEKISLPDSY